MKRTVMTLLAIFILLSLNVFTQACSSSLSFKLDNYFSNSSNAGSGTTYDGKLVVILHNHVDGFTCEGHEAPKSILYKDSNNHWFYSENSVDKCNVIYQQPVDQQVTYDEVTMIASYAGTNFSPPATLIFKVVASEDANTPDVDLNDGVCANLNGKCSLKSAFDQTLPMNFTNLIDIQIENGTYKLNQWLWLNNNHKVMITGQDKLNTTLDGQKLTKILRINGQPGGSVVISKLGFASGFATQSNSVEPYGGAISAVSKNYDLTIQDCMFIGNSAEKGGGAIYLKGEHYPAHLKNLFVGGSTITSDLNTYSEGSAIWITGGAIIEDSNISGNGNNTEVSFKNTIVLEQGGPFLVKNTSINQNVSKGVALTFRSCIVSPCGIENTTIASNGGLGLKFDNSSQIDPHYVQEYGISVVQNVYIKNSTLANNGDSTSPNYSNLWVWTHSDLKIENSAFKVRLATDLNCSIGADSVSGANNFVNNASCGISTRVADLLLGTLANNSPSNAWNGDTLLPLFGSPLLNAGANCLPRDAYGNSRAAICDVGALEVP